MQNRLVAVLYIKANDTSVTTLIIMQASGNIFFSFTISRVLSTDFENAELNNNKKKKKIPTVNSTNWGEKNYNNIKIFSYNMVIYIPLACNTYFSEFFLFPYSGK